MSVSVLELFHPVVRNWFRRRFAAPTDAQALGWPRIFTGRDTLIAAPTGSGKTLAAFLVAIDGLLRKAEDGGLEDAVEVVYISPLKALSNDIQRNLEQPLSEIAAIAREMGMNVPQIRTAVRTGDSPAFLREEILRRPPHILITTPESLYLMLTAERSRQILRATRTVIVDEVHALLGDKRGSHLALTLARLDHVCGVRPGRIGLSATMRPLDQAACFLTGSERLRSGDGTADCAIVDVGHQRDLDIAIEAPPTDLEAVCSNQQWNDIYGRVAELVREHKTTLVFVNTRRLAERMAHHLGERLGREHVAAHHGSLARDRRLELEQRLKAGGLKALVATASLELGIDIGAVDLVCQIESPRSVATFLQRVGRSGHALGLTPKGRLFPTTRDELIESAALVRAVHAGRLDALRPPIAPLDVLAQQIVAECASEPWHEDALYGLVRKAWPYAGLDRRDFNDVVDMLSEGVSQGNGRLLAYLHRDRLNGILRGRRGARTAAIENGGAIPETADYRVLAEPEGTFVGTVNEDFAVESMAGNIFLLGSTSWRIRKIEPGVVRVEDAQGAPPNIPFWLGEAPARTAELSEEVSRLRKEVAEESDAALATETGAIEAIEQIVRYVRAETGSIGLVPTQESVVFERFFDDTGGMQVVVHAPFGARINRAWGLVLRKRFCRTFDFELQAAATDDGILLSLGPQHSFPLDALFEFVKAENVEETLTQALLASPMFTTRWRWNASRALGVLRQRHGKRVPHALQRMRSDDLLAAVFPQQVACQENVTGPLDLPDHPLVRQTVDDCLHEAMDLEGLKAVLARVERGEIKLFARDTTEPSPFAHEALNSKPYTYLDNAPLEERRARAISLRRVLPESARDLGTLDPEAIERVRQEAWPQPRDAEETHEALQTFVAIREREIAQWRTWLEELRSAGRAFPVQVGDESLWTATDRLPLLRLLYPEMSPSPDVRLPDTLPGNIDEVTALKDLLRGHLECLGPLTPSELAQRTLLSEGRLVAGLAVLEVEGVVLRGCFRAGLTEEEVCDRRLLARIHRYTLDRLRQEIEPVTVQDFLRFLLRWHHLAPGTQLEGRQGLAEAVSQLQGFEAPAVAWERHILPARVAAYRGAWLDDLCLSGEVVWGRLSARKAGGNGRSAGTSSSTTVSLARRADLPWLLAGLRNGYERPRVMAGAAGEILELLESRGALFYDDIRQAIRRLPSDLDSGLWELVGRGILTSDGFQPLRSLMASGRRTSNRGHRSQWGARQPLPSGRWSLLHASLAEEISTGELVQQWVWQLLNRYGVVLRDLVQRESLALPWREALQTLRRMEARGEVRGGRFVAGVYGEQYALPEAVEALRRVRRQEKRGEIVRISGVDPLNLAGILTPGPRIPFLHTNSIALKDGLPVDVQEAARRGGRRRAEPAPLPSRA